MITDDDTVYAKEGSLGAAWTLEYGVGDAAVVSVASDPTNGPLIAVLTGPGAVYAKEGSLGAGVDVGNNRRQVQFPSPVTPRMVPSSLS